MTKRTKRFLAVLLTMAMLLSVIGGSGVSASAFTSAESDRSVGLSGSGTEGDPYLISTLADLEIFRDSVNSGKTYEGEFVKLTNDIVMNGPDMFAYDDDGNITGPADGMTPLSWDPIGSHEYIEITGIDSEDDMKAAQEKYGDVYYNRDSNYYVYYHSFNGADYTSYPKYYYRVRFSGTFIGGDHEIKGMYIDSDVDYQGLFGFCLKATVRNLGVTGGYISGARYTASLAGELLNCYITGCYSDCTVNGSFQVGGVAGEARNTSMLSCHNTGNVYGSGNHIGGIAGEFFSQSGYSEYMTYCYNAGSIRGDMSSVGGLTGYSFYSHINKCYNIGAVEGSSFVGGAVGYASGTTGINSAVTYCYNTGSITGANSDIGGIIGRMCNDLTSDCFNTGDVSGPDCTGGIVGMLDQTSSGQTELENCYNTGSVTSVGEEGRTGGIIGLIYNSTSGSAIIRTCYNIGAVTGSGQFTGAVACAEFAESSYAYITVSDCYYLAGTAEEGIIACGGAGTEGCSNVTELTYEQMKEQSSFEGFDFDLVWTMDGSRSYPYPELDLLNMVENSDYKGAGTKDDPYRIYDLADLEEFRDSVNSGKSYEGEYVRLMNDITMNSSDVFAYDDGVISGIADSKTPYTWTPIGNSDDMFSGCFDGGGHSVSGLYINNNMSYMGLFGCCRNAELSNINTRGGYVLAYNNVAALVSNAYNTKVSHCSNTCIVECKNMYAGGLVGEMKTLDGGSAEITDCVNSGYVKGSVYIGGVSGSVSDTIVKNCHNTGHVKGTWSNSGGIAGNVLNGSEVSFCYNTGVLDGMHYIGGITGIFDASSISRCYNSGKLSGSDCIGGIAGTSDSSVVSDCYNTGSVTGYDGVGGIVGAASVRDGERYEISHCYNIAEVKGSLSTAAIAGRMGASGDKSAQLSECRYIYTAAPVAVNDFSSGENLIVSDVDPLTEEQMQVAAYFTGFDFETVWTMDGNADYPYPELISVPMIYKAENSGDGKGSGTQDDPYRVYTLADLEELRDRVNGGETFKGEYFRLMNDITMNGPEVFTYDKNGAISGIADSASPYIWSSIGGHAFYSLGTTHDSDAFSSMLDEHGMLFAKYDGHYSPFIKMSYYNQRDGVELYYSIGFSGIFDGNSHVIKGLCVSPDDTYQGLFGYCQDARISDLGMTDSYIAANGYCGSIAGITSGGSIENCYSSCTVSGSGKADHECYIGGLVGTAYSDVTDCRNLGVITNYRSEGYYNSVAGGIVGGCNRGTVSECTNEGKISGQFVGGIAGTVGYSGEIADCENIAQVSAASCAGGIAESSGGVIRNCVNNGSVVSDSGAAGIVYDLRVGNKWESCDSDVLNCVNTGFVSGNNCSAGIAGEVAPCNKSTVNIRKCFNTGEIVGIGKHTGGIVAYAVPIWNGVLTIEDCYNTGWINGWEYAGGIAGEIDTPCGVTVQRCYNAGYVTGDNAAELIGMLSTYNSTGEVTSLRIENCYYLDEAPILAINRGTTTANETIKSVKGLTDDQMRSASCLGGFDFVGTWTMGGSSSYPYPELIGTEMPDCYFLGDTDGDLSVTILDATVLQRHLADLPVSSYDDTAADADSDGEVTILDATAIQRHLADLPTNNNIGRVFLR